MFTIEYIPYEKLILYMDIFFATDYDIDMNNFLECTGKSGNVCNQCARICAASRVDASPLSLSPAHHHRADKV